MRAEELSRAVPAGRHDPPVDLQIELRPLRYFVAVAEELHFGRAAERLYMSQSPLSRAIRELERDLGLVLFRRTTRQVELTPAGEALLVRARRALAEVQLGVEDARRAAGQDATVAHIGHGPLSRGIAARVGAALGGALLDEDVSPELLRRVAARELAAAVVLGTPAGGRPDGVRIDALRDEPLLAALPPGHPHAAGPIPLEAFAAERVMLPRGPVGRQFTTWLRAVVRVAGHELPRTFETLSAPWDHRMLPVAQGEAVSVVVAEWADDPAAGFAAVPFDPPLSVPFDLATPAEGAGALVAAALRLRDEEGWLVHRPPYVQAAVD